jgi:hypothetical protein
VFADRYGYPLTTSSAGARDAWVRGADLLLAGMPGAEDEFSAAITADPAFALAWIARGRSRAIYGRGTEARSDAARARALARLATPREQGQVDVLALAIEGRAADALAATRVHIARHPRDAMALAPATSVFGLIGFSGRTGRERELLALLDDLAPHYGADWWFLAAHAFARCECGQLDAAREGIERSLSIEPRNAHAIHIRAHVHYECGEDAEGGRLVRAWLAGYPKAGQMHCHLAWHAAMFDLSCGHPEDGWATFDQAIHPAQSESPPLNTQTDGVAWLWRAELAGEARRAQAWSDVCAFALERFPKAGVTFADVHTAAALAATGDEARLAQLCAELRAGFSTQWAAEVAEACARGFRAFERREWDGVIGCLAPVIDQHERIGGSRAQRDLVELTLLAAYRRAGRSGDAQALLARRTDRGPTVPG